MVDLALHTKVWRFVLAKWHEGTRGSLSMMAWKRSFEKVTHLKYDNVWTWIFQSGVKFVPLNHQNQTWGLKFDIWLEGLGTYTRVIPINFNELDRGVPGKSTMIGSMVLDHHFFVPFDAEKATKNMTHTQLDRRAIRKNDSVLKKTWWEEFNLLKRFCFGEIVVGVSFSLCVSNRSYRDETSLGWQAGL